MGNASLKSIQITIRAQSRGTRNVARKYSCWLCDKECGNTAEYLMHLQEHKDAIESQEI